jgi:hypothetical protein
MYYDDRVTVGSITARIERLQQDVRRLPTPQLLPPDQRGAVIAAMAEMVQEIETLTDEAIGLLRRLDAAEDGRLA